MIAIAFKQELADLNAGDKAVNRLWTEIETRYTTANRHYHTLKHLDNLLNELRLIKDKIKDWQTIIFSIAYHDIIYNTLKQNNEEKSAAFAYQRLGSLNVSAGKKEKCNEMILATKYHSKSIDSDTNYFTDADLAILGAPCDIYNEYARQVRQEYKFYPDLLYKPGRKKVLQHFLEMETIYKTTHFINSYEQLARQNIHHEINGLVR